MKWLASSRLLAIALACTSLPPAPMNAQAQQETEARRPGRDEARGRAALGLGSLAGVLDIASDCGVRERVNQREQLQACLNRVTTMGKGPYQSLQIVMPCGEYWVDGPLYLPKSGATPTHVLQWAAPFPRCAVLRATGDNWRPGDAPIMWDPTDTNRVWHVAFKGFTIIAPRADQTYGVHYKPVDKTRQSDVPIEFLNIAMEDMVVEAWSEFNPAALYLEGYVRYCTMDRVRSRVSPANRKYSTWLFLFDHEILTASGIIVGDFYGANWCTFREVGGVGYGGGINPLMKGRVSESRIERVYIDGVNCTPEELELRARQRLPAACGSDIHLINSIGTTIENVGTEGRSEFAQIILENCQDIVIENIRTAQPDSGKQRTVGIMFINTSNSEIRHSFTVDGKLWFSHPKIDGRYFSFDERSHNNLITFAGFTGAMDPEAKAFSAAAEREIDDEGRNNCVQLISMEEATLGMTHWHGQCDWAFPPRP